MISKITKYLPAAIMLLSMGWLAACSDNDDNGQDEWTATYVYLQRTDFLEGNVKEFEIGHTPLGLTGEVSMDFSAKLNKVADRDVSVAVSVEGSQLLPSANFRLVDTDGNALASNVLTIKAGQLSSDTIRMVCDDLSPLASIDNEDTETCYVKIDNVDTRAANTLVAKNPNMKQLNFNINKDKKRYIMLGSLPEGCSEIPASSLALTLYGASSYASNPNSLLDGSQSTFVRFRVSGSTGVQIDLGEEKTIVGLQTMYYSSWYSANNVTIHIADGDEWKEVGTIDVSGDTQMMNLLGKPKTRYIYYQINGPVGNYSYIYMTQVHVYTE